MSTLTPPRAEPARPLSPEGISDADFALMRDIIEEVSGIRLGASKKALLVGRLARRLRDTGAADFRAYARLVTDPAREAELTQMLDCICTNETRFFREPPHWEILRERARELAERIARDGGARRVRCWSAACSSGEEPYSIAMALRDRLPPGFEAEVLATDLSTKVLARAAGAVYPIERALQVPEEYRRRFLLRGGGPAEGTFRVGPEARAGVTFARMNLVEDDWSASGPYDFVFCRNVLIYFSPEARARVIHRLIDRLAAGGVLFLGCAESLHGVTDRVSAIGPAAYVLAAGTAAERRRA